MFPKLNHFEPCFRCRNRKLDHIAVSWPLVHADAKHDAKCYPRCAAFVPFPLWYELGRAMRTAVCYATIDLPATNFCCEMHARFYMLSIQPLAWGDAPTIWLSERDSDGVDYIIYPQYLN